MRFYVYRHGANTANQPHDDGPKLVAEVEAHDEQDACGLALRRVSCFNNQHLSARRADDVDAREAMIDAQVNVVN